MIELITKAGGARSTFDCVWRCYSSVVKNRLKSRLDDLVNYRDNDIPDQTRNRAKEARAAARNERAQIASKLPEFFSDINNVAFKKANISLRHPEILKYLGTSTNQLKNSFIVTRDVDKLLRNDRIPEAVLLIRLAGKEGTVGMNHLLQSLASKGKHQLAIKLLNKMKKWGVDETSYTTTALASSRSLEKLIKQYDLSDAQSKNRLLIGNSFLKTICKRYSFEEARAFYDRLDPKDVVSHTIMLNCIAKASCNGDESVREFRDGIFDGVTSDAKLLRAYLGCLVASPLATDKLKAKALVSRHSLTLSAVPEDVFVSMKVLNACTDYEAARSVYTEAVKRDSKHANRISYQEYTRALGFSGRVALVENEVSQISEYAFVPDSPSLANLMKVNMFCELSEMDFKLQTKLESLCKKFYGKKPHLMALCASLKVYNRFMENGKIHPREGLKRLDSFAISSQVVSSDLASNNGSNVEICKEIVGEAAKLSKLVYEDDAWRKHKHVWVEKLGQFCRNLLASDCMAQDVDEFNDNMKTIMLRSKTVQEKNEKTKSQKGHDLARKDTEQL